MQTAREAGFRPPIVSMAFAFFWGVVAYHLYGYSQKGIAWASLLCFLAWLMAAGQLIKALNDRSTVKLLKRKHAAYKEAGAKLAHSRLAVEADVQSSDLFSDHEGIFLGVLPRGKNGRRTRDVYYCGDASMAVVAPTGEMKTNSIAVPSILSCKDHCLILNDISGELYAIVGRALEAMGYELKVMTPYPKQVSELIGREVIDAGLDIFSSFTRDMPPDRIRDDLRSCMQWKMPAKPGALQKDDYFLKAGQMIGSLFGMHEIHEGRKPSLPGIRHHVMQGMGAISELYEYAERSSAFGGAYAQLARSVHTLLEKAPQQLAGGWGIAEQAFEPFDEYSALGKHTLQSTLDPLTLKSDRKQAVFLIHTLEKMEANADLIAMSLTYLFDTLTKSNGSRRVTAIIDEAGSLSMPTLASSLNFYRKALLRCLLIYQDIQGQTEKTLGKANTSQIMAACKLKVGMGLQEPETLEMFSKLCGTQSIATVSMNNRPQQGKAAAEVHNTYGHQGVPLLRPEDIRTMKEILVVGGSIPPLLLNKVPYWQRKAWAKITEPSPFYKG